jgi:hypothetical protein
MADEEWEWRDPFNEDTPSLAIKKSPSREKGWQEEAVLSARSLAYEVC